MDTVISTDKTGFTPLPKRQAKASMTCVVLAMFLGALSQTVVATTMPLIIADLGGFDRYTWAATSYLVAVTLAFPIVGRLSDIYGRRLLLLLGLAIFAIGSILLGFSESMTQVVGYRAVQGVGGGTIITCCYVSVADLYPPDRTGQVSWASGRRLRCILCGRASAWRISCRCPVVAMGVLCAIGLAAIPVFLLTVKVFPTPVSLPENRDLDLAGMVALVLTVVPLLIALVFWESAVRTWIDARPRNAAVFTGDERDFHCRRSTGQVADLAPFAPCGSCVRSFRRHHVAAQLRAVWKCPVPSPVVPGSYSDFRLRAKRCPARPDVVGHGCGRGRGGTSPFQGRRLVSDSDRCSVRRS